MDFENKGAQEIQKINDLAFNLQKQAGMSRDEALQQAERMISKSYKFEVNEISPQKLKEMEAPRVEKHETKMDWQEAMGKNNEFIVKSFKEMKNEIASLKADLDLLKNQMKNNNCSRPAEPANPQKTLAKEEKSNTDNPRQGNYKSNDVSVEKYFYFGNKKQ